MREMISGSAAILTILAGFLAAAPPTHAWGANGHRITGQVAEEALSEPARAAVRRIAGARTLAMLGTWPDFARSEPNWGVASTWHYVSVEDGGSLAEVIAESARTPEPDDIVEAIGYFRDILAGDADRRRHFEELMSRVGVEPYEGSVELTALSFLAHFVGDLHQPLHVGRAGDRGGNNVSVNFFGEIMNMHSVWDSGIIERQELSFTEYTAFLHAELAGRVQAGDGGVEAWARESFEYRPRLYEIWSRTSRDNYLPELGFRYVYDHLGTVNRRLYLGGLRLAGMLNEIFE